MKNKSVLPLLTIIAMLVFSSSSLAENTMTADGVTLQRGWYFGIDGGIPFGKSTFSSFGYDKTHLGWTAGLYGGYKFTRVLSAEFTVKYGQMILTARDCCAERDYWLGIDGVRYNAAVLGVDSWNYRALQSRINIGQYGARFNVNILGIFNKTMYSRWSIALSPHLYAISTKASVQTIVDGAEKLKSNMKWHLGYGADLQVACHLTPHLQLGIYSGITILNGSKMDAMPEYLHKTNLVWESGLRLGFVFGKNKKKSMKEEVPPSLVVCPEETEAPSIAEPQKTPVVITTTKGNKTVAFPDIYFDFNKTSIPASEEEKLHEILATLKENPDMKITVRGWCDTKGTVGVNKRCSEARAKAVKAWLVERGISFGRIESIGMGSDFNMPEAAKARRVSTENQKN